MTTKFDDIVTQIKGLAKHNEFDVIEVTEEGDGGTVILRNISYHSLIIDVSDESEFNLSTIRYPDEAEKNKKTVKSLRGVYGYLNEYADSWE